MPTVNKEHFQGAFAAFHKIQLCCFMAQKNIGLKYIKKKKMAAVLLENTQSSCFGDLIVLLIMFVKRKIEERNPQW